MKHVYTLLLALACINAYSQIIYQEDFSSGEMPDGIELYNLDGLTPDDPDLITMADSAWTIRFISAQGFTGGNAAFSVSWYQGDEGPSNDWMVLPAIQLGSDPYLQWTGMAITSSGNFRDQYQVFVSTTGNTIDDFILLAPIFDTGQIGELPQPTPHSISLSDFAGQEVWIAFRNATQPYNPDLPSGPGNGGNELAIDDIVVSEGPAGLEELGPIAEASIFPNPSSANAMLSIALREASSMRLEVISSEGKLIRSEVFNGMGQGTHQLDIQSAELSSGVYVLRIIAADQTTQLRFIKE